VAEEENDEQGADEGGSVIDVTAQQQGGTPVSVKFNMPESLAACVDAWGEEVTYSHVRRSVIIALQALVRLQTKGENPKTEQEIQDIVNEWKPGQRKVGKPAADKVHDLLAKLSPADRAALLQQYKPRTGERKDEPAA
jgi:hypothetical protein